MYCVTIKISKRCFQIILSLARSWQPPQGTQWCLDCKPTSSIRIPSNVICPMYCRSLLWMMKFYVFPSYWPIYASPIAPRNGKCWYSRFRGS